MYEQNSKRHTEREFPSGKSVTYIGLPMLTTVTYSTGQRLQANARVRNTELIIKIRVSQNRYDCRQSRIKTFRNENGLQCLFPVD